ncbi:MAG: hypothetical protein LQ349_002098 [Xanthoria aureola]|nr:MAG: hypothetical protein LQ349_002098 [Xanthoria aureola]
MLQPTTADEQDLRPVKIQRPSGHDDVTSSAQSQHSSACTEDPDELAGLPMCEDSHSHTSGNKRKRSTDDFRGADRLTISRLAAPMPIYGVKISTKIKGQPKGLEWRSSAAKNTFDMEYSRRRAEWGVNLTHVGTCILVPEDWKNVDPLEMLKLFDLENCPSGQAPRLRFCYSDHGTAFARALAWFAKWPRSGLEQDNFIGDGGFKPMDASHTCHHDTCIIHVTYEPTHINHDRKNCCGEARKLRQEGKDIPEHCEHHSPPCLLQHAALTTNEAFSIQFDVLRRARGISPDPTPLTRPRRHRWSTFEGYLPCRYPAIKVDPDNLALDRPASRRIPGKPDLICMFCKKIKAFDSAAGYWGHLVHKHDGIDTSNRLDEIRRTAAQWKVYFDIQDGGKGGRVMKYRLEELMQDGFDWDAVLAWGLR